jgi:hypothetical protein
MSASISIADTLLLLRKVEEEAVPVELVGEGPGEQAIVMIGFVRVSEEGTEFSVHVPSQLAVTVVLSKATIEYGDPREAPPEHRARAQRLLQFMIKFRTEEWNGLVRVWRRPEEVKPY